MICFALNKMQTCIKSLIYRTIRSAYIGFGVEQIVFILFLDCFLCFFAVALFALAQASASHSHIKQNYDDKFIYLLLAMCAIVYECKRETERERGRECESERKRV